jgi:hypothetical protein
MGTHRASGEVKAGTDWRTAVVEATAVEGIPEGSLRLRPEGSFREPESDSEPQARRYVPISQLARYFTCSFVSVSIFIPMPASLRRAISLSMTGGTG